MKILQLLFLISMVTLLAIMTLLYGEHQFSFKDLLHIYEINKTDYYILHEIRLPRLIISLYCGILFALAGNIFQVIYKNPVASPDLLGVNATTIFAILFFSNIFGAEHLLTYALIGAVSGFALTITLANKDKKMTTLRLIIIGIAISILFKALSQLLVIQTKENIHGLLHFLNGSLYHVSWQAIKTITYPTAALITGCLIGKRYLDIMALHATTVKSIGFNLSRWQTYFIGLALVMTAIAVSLSGSLGFIGLIAPNISRLLFGFSHRYTLYGSMLIGCLFILGADLIGRILFYPLEIPAGMIMIFLGTPVFIYLLKKVNSYE